MTDPATDTTISTTANESESETITETDTQPTTATATVTVTEQPRRLIKFVKNEPGYRISVTVNMLFLLNGLLFAVFAITSIWMPSESPDEIFDIMDIVGIFIFCMWNSIVFTLIILFPSITTINREKVRPSKKKQPFLTSFSFFRI